MDPIKEVIAKITQLKTKKQIEKYSKTQLKLRNKEINKLNKDITDKELVCGIFGLKKEKEKENSFEKQDRLIREKSIIMDIRNLYLDKMFE